MKYLQVGPHRYSVSYAHADVLAASYDLNGQLAGYCDKTQQRIVIDKTHAAGYLRDVHLHEALHAVVEVYGLDDIVNGNEERFVNRLAPALLALLRDNPKLVELLLADETSPKGKK